MVRILELGRWLVDPARSCIHITGVGAIKCLVRPLIVVNPDEPVKAFLLFAKKLNEAGLVASFLRLISRMICSDDDVRPAGFCFISTPQVRINKNTLLNQN